MRLERIRPCGGFALLLAPGRGFSASSVNNPATGKEAYSESVLTGACLIVGSYSWRSRVWRHSATAGDADVDAGHRGEIGSGQVIGKLGQAVEPAQKKAP